MLNLLPWALMVQTLFLIGGGVFLLRRLQRSVLEGPIHALREGMRSDAEDLEAKLRSEIQEAARVNRQELLGTLAHFQQTLLAQNGDVARTQNEQIDSFRTQLTTFQQILGQSLQDLGGTLAQQGLSLREVLDSALKKHAESASIDQQRVAQSLTQRLESLSESNERRLADVRTTLERQLAQLQQGNEQKLEQMRATVNEKLHATLEQRLGDSFKHVSERLEQVHRGLGEMQNLAKDVGSLNRVLSNVKSRGVFGEVQLFRLLEQVFTPEQYGANVEVVPGTLRRVEFAIKLPGRHEGLSPVWLPIDAKFPREDYDRLLEAQERADPQATEASGRALELAFKKEAAEIHAKYVAPPHTTDFAILFVPTEGLYAEALRRPGLVEWMQQECRIMMAGPTTLLAVLNSLQVGFRTLALEHRSVEVWELLGAVKTEFQKFGDVLAKTKKKLEEASSAIEKAEQRTRVMGRTLRSVEALPDDRVSSLISDSQRPEEAEDPVQVISS
jgi:DNA recombination protein RmuC